ncbi:hypothetical protein BMS3Bbin12_01659 [bacterium BMS3Bbin12]|nr:hypothetical protein BMS3Bbin12_01659 [bacterium BMS3Bbin12]GBE51468.1 hypothetical protein BMS3Bbin13_02429 [bacterium BMS3Bbin13]
MLVAEGLEQQRQRAWGAPLDALAYQVAELVHVGAGGVDLQVRALGDRREQTALQRDRLGERDPVTGERVFAPRLAEALEERFVAGVDEEDLTVRSAVLELFHDLREVFQGLRLVAGVDPHRGLFDVQAALRAELLGERPQHADRQVVDAIVVQVLERVQHDALPGARQAADDDEPHGRPRSMKRRWRSMKSRPES